MVPFRYDDWSNAELQVNATKIGTIACGMEAQS
jgi:hypothetical protein